MLHSLCRSFSPGHPKSPSVPNWHILVEYCTPPPQEVVQSSNGLHEPQPIKVIKVFYSLIFCLS